jgi:hypothetical protein
MEEKNNDCIPVKEVRDEYAYIKNNICEKCGSKGSYEVELQRLVEISFFPCDELDCVCKNCGNKKTFVFDVTAVFEGYKKMFGTDG